MCSVLLFSRRAWVKNHGRFAAVMTVDDVSIVKCLPIGITFLMAEYEIGSTRSRRAQQPHQ
jgi:hypothetical protein